jgi:hypothetical protein
MRQLFSLLILGVVLLVPDGRAQQPNEAPGSPLPSETAETLTAEGPEAGTLYLTTERFRLKEGGFS